MEICQDSKKSTRQLIDIGLGQSIIQYGTREYVPFREDGPAVILLHGMEEWYTHPTVDPEVKYEPRRPDRKDGPAVITPIGAEFWYKEGIPHREDGGPAIINLMIRPDTSEEMWCKEWYINGNLCRPDGGPTAEWADGTKHWHENGRQVRAEFENASGKWIWERNKGFRRRL